MPEPPYYFVVVQTFEIVLGLEKHAVVISVSSWGLSYFEEELT